MKPADLQDGICHKIVGLFLCNGEKTMLSGKFSLTVNILYVMIIMLGRLDWLPFFEFWEAFFP